LKGVLLDTHAWAWSLDADSRLSVTARRSIAGATAVYVSPISFYEIGQKVRLGKWPEMQPFIDRLPLLLEEQGGRIAGLTPAIALAGAAMDWSHRDPFDRILAATAEHYGLPLVSADAVFDGRARRLW
jgi:PIN domain nuclease of toxin-antitoxin system